MKLREGTAADAPRAFAIWRGAVDATHGFLSPADKSSIAAMVHDLLRTAPLTIAEDDGGEPQGFMIFADGVIEALFVDPEAHGRGYGSALVAHAISLDPQARVDANEQATNASPFYEARGFVRVGRSERDSAGRPYPIIHLRHPGPEAAIT
ncbi:acetyltransferase [Novosphingobium sp. RD2P27]|uniref:Acetyltransferase n=1 Tax=Novosphingobium kalidii TaxID=3230299 RepID=A0ABV2D6I8_9SPHN